MQVFIDVRGTSSGPGLAKALDVAVASAALVLHDVCNFPYAEICNLLDQSRITVSQCIADARSALLQAGLNTGTHVMAGKVG